MELAEKIETINNQLISLFGVDTLTGKAMYRVVWSHDQFEKRLTEYTDEGLQLLHPEVRLLPKYRQWADERYILEHLVLIPDGSEELTVMKQSYEPLYVFMDRQENYAPPSIELAKLVIDCVLAATGKESLGPKYSDPDATLETQEARVDSLYKELYGNETPVTDALAYKEGVTVPSNYKKES